MEVYLTWQFWYQVLSAFAFGVASSLVPVLNSELFIVGALGSRLLGPLEVALGLALGHGDWQAGHVRRHPQRVKLTVDQAQRTQASRGGVLAMAAATME